MAENKKSFLFYIEWIDTFEGLEDAEAGKLIKHVLSYVNDKNPVTDSRIINIAFTPIKQQLKRDLKKWDEIRNKRSEAGSKSAEKRTQQKSTKPTLVEFVQQTSTKPTVEVKVEVEEVNTLEGFNLNFIDQDFLKPIVDWATYRKNTLKKEITTQQVLEACYRQLHELSGKDPKEAERIVTYTISNNYKSLCKDDRKVVVKANPMQGVL